MKYLVVICLVFALALGNELAEVKEERDKRASKTKVGIAWNDGNNANIYALAGGNGWSAAGWTYDWNSIPVNSQIANAGLEYIPMMWGTRSGDISNFNTAKNNGFYGASAILGFNEPDNGGQSNLSPAAAAAAWKLYIQPLNIRKGAPAVTSAPSGIPWLQQFFAACSGCTVDFIPIHWYGSDPAAFTSYVTQVHNTFGKNIWVTEWACVNYDGKTTCQDQNYVYGFVGATTLFLYDNAWVERYAYFGALRNMNGIPDTNRLITADGTTNTPLGVQYAGRGGCCPCYNAPASC